MLFLHDLYTYIVPIFVANFIVGIISWPISNKFFNKLADKGYAAAHIMGWMCISLAIFTLSIINSRIFPFTVYTLRIIVFFWFVINVIVFKTSGLKTTKSLLKTIAVTQIIFFILLVTLSFVKGSDGNIYRGERLMNFSILNALQHTDKLPLSDFWLSGQILNYYYFGHVIGFAILELSGISIFNGFFILEAWLFATLAINIFNLGKLLYERTSDNKNAAGMLAGFLSVFYVLASGTFYTLAWFLKNIYNKISGVDVFGFPSTFSIGYVYGTITEIPVISFLIQELHAHTWDLLISTLIVTLLVFIWSEAPKTKHYAFLGILLGVVYMTNPWDLITYGSLIILVSLFRLPLKRTAFYIALMSFITLVTTVPFTSYFITPVTQIGLVMNHTPMIKWLILWGPFVIITIIFITLSRRKLNDKNYSLYYLVLSLISLIFISTELMFFKDINAGSIWYRGNTVFKFWYQIWFLWALISGPISVKIALLIKTSIKKWLYIIVAGSIGVAQCLYILIMLQIIFTNPYKGMENGFSWWNEKYPSDYQAYQYLRDNVLGKPIIIEGTNPTPYKDNKFFSSTLNWNSVLGMPTHEVTWHNNSKEVWERIYDVEEFYKGTDPEKSKELINKYGVNYAILGELEKGIYGDKLQEDKIKSLGKVIYDKDKTAVVMFN